MSHTHSDKYKTHDRRLTDSANPSEKFVSVLCIEGIHDDNAS